MAAAGSAVGLGNIWKFPYIAGENGGGAFLIVYLISVLLFGLPLLMTEFYIGKRSGRSAFDAFRVLAGNNHWQWLSWLCVITAFLIMGFYFVVTGWCFSYLFDALSNALRGCDVGDLAAHFEAVNANKPRMIAFSILPIVMTASVLWFDVNKGIERLSKILMPLLLLMMLLMAGSVLMLDGSNVGMKFFLQIDFSKITPEVLMMAMGQCFFSLSIGMGALITYGAYMPKNQSVVKTSLQVIIMDTMVAIMAGLIIFPAVFAFGFDPAEGPQLVFVVLPAIFEQMSFAWLSSILFFSLLCIAALTSTISLMEVTVAFLSEVSAHHNYPLNRHKSVLVISALVMAIMVACIFIPGLFNDFDRITSCYMMPLASLGMSIFMGWKMSKNFKSWHGKLFTAVLRWIVPIGIIIIFLNSLGLI